MRKLCLGSVAVLVLVSLSFAQAPSPDSPEIEQKVNAVLSKMTLEQKIDFIGGINIFDVRGFPNLGLPLLHTADGPKASGYGSIPCRATRFADAKYVEILFEKSAVSYCKKVEVMASSNIFLRKDAQIGGFHNQNAKRATPANEFARLL